MEHYCMHELYCGNAGTKVLIVPWSFIKWWKRRWSITITGQKVPLLTLWNCLCFNSRSLMAPWPFGVRWLNEGGNLITWSGWRGEAHVISSSMVKLIGWASCRYNLFISTHVHKYHYMSTLVLESRFQGKNGLVRLCLWAWVIKIVCWTWGCH